MDVLPNRKMTRNTSSFIILIDLVLNPTQFVGIQSTMERETTREKCKNNSEGGGDTISIKILH
jgi:hypothetical protein